MYPPHHPDEMQAAGERWQVLPSDWERERLRAGHRVSRSGLTRDVAVTRRPQNMPVANCLSAFEFQSLFCCYRSSIRLGAKPPFISFR